jgi:hypothetical protein
VESFSNIALASRVSRCQIKNNQNVLAKNKIHSYLPMARQGVANHKENPLDKPTSKLPPQEVNILLRQGVRVL